MKLAQDNNSAAASPKLEDDFEPEDLFGYTRSNIFYFRMIPYCKSESYESTKIEKFSSHNQKGFIFSGKICSKYAEIQEKVHSVELVKDERGGLGLSLAGHRDRSKLRVFVVDIIPDSVASLAGNDIIIGDELLEVSNNQS